MTTPAVLEVSIWYPLKEEKKFNVLMTRSMTGKEQRRLVATSGLRSFEVNFGIMTKTQKEVLETFYDARYGEYEAFYFPNNNARVVEESIGTKSSGNTYVADHPPTGNILMIDDLGVIEASAGYTVDKITGTFTFTRDVFNCVVSYDPCILVRFDGSISYEEFSNGRFQSTATLVEVL